MTEYICNCNAVYDEQMHEKVSANSKSRTATWNGVWRLLGTIGTYAFEIYHWNNDVQPQFTHGGVRVLIRPDRVDLV